MSESKNLPDAFLVLVNDGGDIELLEVDTTVPNAWPPASSVRLGSDRVYFEGTVRGRTTYGSSFLISEEGGRASVSERLTEAFRKGFSGFLDKSLERIAERVARRVTKGR